MAPNSPEYNAKYYQKRRQELLDRKREEYASDPDYRAMMIKRATIFRKQKAWENSLLDCKKKRIRRFSKTRIYMTWRNMKARCINENHPCYHYYGGRGIKVCQRWMKFKNFLEDMGECPPGLTLERKNNDLGYFLGNCKWATYKEQANNRRRRNNR